MPTKKKEKELYSNITPIPRLCWICAKFGIRNNITKNYFVVTIRYKLEEKEYEEKYELCETCWNHIFDLYDLTNRDDVFPGMNDLEVSYEWFENNKSIWVDAFY